MGGGWVMLVVKGLSKVCWGKGRGDGGFGS